MDFIEKNLEIERQGTPSALVTIIQIKGSTPRKTGAKMIIYYDGTIEGTIGGGCGEGEVIEQAFNVIEMGNPVK